MSKIAIIRIAGQVGLNSGVEYTLQLLGLHKKHACVVVDDSQHIRGMLQKVKDTVTWGVIDEQTVSLIANQAKDGVAHLHPPRGGYERKGTKKAFTQGGALGDRGEAIVTLIKKMTVERGNNGS